MCGGGTSEGLDVRRRLTVSCRLCGRARLSAFVCSRSSLAHTSEEEQGESARNNKSLTLNNSPGCETTAAVTKPPMLKTDMGDVLLRSCVKRECVCVCVYKYVLVTC